MKKKLIPIVSGILVGSLLGAFFLTDINTNVSAVFNKNMTLTAFQVGVYTNMENVSQISANLMSSAVIKEDEIYRVYVALLSDPELIVEMKKYLESTGVEVYLKKVSVNNSEFITNLENYERVLKETSNKDLYNSINKQILKEYENTL